MKYHCLVSLFILITPKLCQDYWSEGFDESKNCEDEKLIGKLNLEKNPQRCATKGKGMKNIGKSRFDIAKAKTSYLNI